MFYIIEGKYNCGLTPQHTGLQGKGHAYLLQRGKGDNNKAQSF